MPQVYTFGYSGRKLSDLVTLAEELDATVFDIRYSPRSRAPQWNKSSLMAALGDRYRHCRDFGNINYRGGPIELVNYEAGKQAIEQSDRAVILMCMCKDLRSCHRNHVAERLAAEGFKVKEVAPARAVQSKLWAGVI